MSPMTPEDYKKQMMGHVDYAECPSVVEGRVQGVVLCGGKAERMPNKLFLARRDGLPVAWSSLDYLVMHGLCNVTLCLHAQDYPGPLFRLMRYYPKQITLGVHTDEHGGLVPLLRNVAKTETAEWLFVLCADNVYPRRIEFNPKRDLHGNGCAFVRASESDHLDGWKVEGRYARWTERNNYPDSNRKLTTPWILRREALLEAVGRVGRPPTLMELFNGLQIKPVEQDGGAWTDIGTPESYKEYMT